MTEASTQVRRTAADTFVRRIHRISATLFLLSIPPAAYASFTGGTSPWVYVPLAPLLFLALTGSYQLVMPWVRRRRAR